MKEQLTKVFSKVSLTLRKYAPEILVVSGVVGLIGAGVLACKETTKLDDVVNECEKRMNHIQEQQNFIDECKEKGICKEDEYTEKDEMKDVVIAYAKNAFSLAKLYFPSIILAIASSAAILGGFGILKKRHAAVVCAFGEMSAAFAEFKKRTEDAVGSEKFHEILDGVSKEMSEVVDDNGNSVEVEVDKVDPVKDPYTFMWDEFTTKETGMYRKGDIAANDATLRGVQQSFNNQLHYKGYVFLNEVLKELGLPETKAGQEVGWVMYPNDDHSGDNYIDFGIQCVDDVNKETMKFTRRYILHFNCDGYILDTFSHAYEGEK